jgi:hypothetical protein
MKSLFTAILILIPGLLSADWTQLNPSADSKIIYVSNAATSSGTGLTANSPKKLNDALAMIRSGFPDWLMLKRGETYPGIPNWNKSGRSASERIVITSYGTGARPVLKASGGDSGAFGWINKTYNHLAIVDVELRGPATFTLDLLGGGSNILFEGVLISGGGYANRVQGYNARFKNLEIKRSVIADNRGGSHSQGLYIESTDGITLEENVIDNNGWTNEGAYWWAQGVYIHGSCGRENVVVKHNIFSNNAHAGIQVRTGGQVYGNLGFNNAVHFGMGTVDPDDPAGNSATPRVTGSISHNVAIASHNLVASQGPRGIGFMMERAQSVSFVENIATQVGAGTAPIFAYFSDSKDIAMGSSIGYNWSSDIAKDTKSVGISSSGVDLRYANQSSIPPAYPFAKRDLGSYAATLGLSNSSAAFIQRARLNSKENWDDRFTAKGAVSYLRGAFGKTSPWDIPAVRCMADLNRDDAVTIEDLTLFMQAFEGGLIAADQNDDRGVDISDLLLFLQRFEAGC